MPGELSPCLPAAEACLVSGADDVDGSSVFVSPQPLKQLIEAKNMMTAKNGCRLNMDHSAFMTDENDPERFDASNGSHVNTQDVLGLL